MFKFRLQTVLDLRVNELEIAERTYLIAKSKREDAEQDLAGIHQMLQDQRRQPRETFQARLDAEAYNQRLEDESRAILTTIGVLEDEEAKAMEFWIDAKKEVKALEKLRDKAEEEYALEMNRKEQAELDEWAVLRRSAA
ncbi:MAG: flagellar export protein FliJ [Fimbriimonadaceae bacterium]